MKKDGKIVFFDIDGTIFEQGKGTPDSTREALRLLKAKGHIPVVCTGNFGPGFSGCYSRSRNLCAV